MFSMNVALITPSYPSDRCGIATYTDALASALRKHVDVTVIGRETFASPRPLSALTRSVQNADLVHVQHAFDLYGYMGWRTLPIFLLLSRLNKPIVTTIHELPDDLDHSARIKERISYAYLRQVLGCIHRCSTLLLVHTHTNQHQLQNWWARNHVKVIPHGSSFPDVSTTTPQSDLLPSVKGRSRIGFLGFIKPSKGIEQIVDALPYLPDVDFVMAGAARSDADKAYLREIVRSANELNVDSRLIRFDFLPDESIAGFLDAIDVLVFPYRHSTASGILHIAMAHQVVVLTSDLPGFAEMKRTFHCLETYHLDDIDDLAKQLQQLLSDSLLRQSLVVGTQRVMDATNWDQIALQLTRSYSDLIRSPQKEEAIA